MTPRRVSLHVHRCSCGSPTRLLRGARFCPRCDSPGSRLATWAQERTHATR